MRVGLIDLTECGFSGMKTPETKLLPSSMDSFLINPLYPEF